MIRHLPAVYMYTSKSKNWFNGIQSRKRLFADRVSANKKLFADSGVPIEKKHDGGGLLYGGLLPERNFQVEYLQIFFYLQIPYLQITFYLQIGICKYLFICR